MDTSPEDGTPEKETGFSGSDDMLAFAAMCEQLAGQAEFQTEIAANGVWPEVADVEETVVTATPMPTVVDVLTNFVTVRVYKQSHHPFYCMVHTCEYCLNGCLKCPYCYIAL